MSEQPQEEPQAAPEVAPDEQATPIQPPDEAAPGVTPDEQDEEDEAHESEEVEGQQGDQGEQEPPEAQVLSQKEIEARWKKFEKSSQVWRDRVATIMETDVEMLLPCPLCHPLIPGYLMPTPDTPERFPAVREFMGDAQPRQLQPDPDTEQCSVCKGEGMLDMKSKVQGQEALICGYCSAKGWVGTRHAVPASGPMAVQPLPDANGQSEVTPQGPEPPEAAKLRAMGYTLIQPVGAN